ncbi:MAG: hypothetical protein PHV37_01085 [Candidatus Gastranaerophilales bacterium]|nr:hypothetical protein [Candidatus Gastranaerophilales bacterium]
MEEQSISNKDFFKEIDNIKDISILQNIKQFYECESSNFIADFNNNNQKLSSLFNMSAIFLGYFITIIVFLSEQKYFTNLSYLQIFSVFTLEVGLVLLFSFTCKIFILQRFKSGYRRIDTTFPVLQAYENKLFKGKREKEFLVQMVYNYYLIIKENNKLLDEQSSKLLGKHDNFITYVIIITISLLFIILG